MDLIVNQLKGKVLATSRRIQKKYELKLERQQHGRKATIDTEQAADVSAGHTLQRHHGVPALKCPPPQSTLIIRCTTS